MIKHIVMWTLQDFAENATRQENALKIKRLLEGLKGKAGNVRSLEVGVNINGSAAAYDIVLCAEFDSIQDLNAYQKHPEHLRVGEFIGKVRLDRKVVDYEV
ncbi:MAG: Dabb family protein [Dehalococcoidales bacterium]|jgi:hypothetical protein